MRAHIVDKMALEAVSPAALRAYALFQNWKRMRSYGQFSEIYGMRVNGQDYEIALPFTTNIADYASAVGSLIRILSLVEQRDELDVYADLIQADWDVIRIRAPDADDNGSIGIDPGVGIFHHARDLLASAACATLEPRRAYHLGKVQKAEEYMRRVRLGQTEQGSFVVTLLAPIPPALSPTEQMSFWPSMNQEPFERQVTRVLSNALRAAHSAIVVSNRGDGLSAFEMAVASGVSANLCEAIASIVDQGEGADLSITWARTRPTPHSRDLVTFRRADAEVLKEAARQFRLLEPRRDEQILGYVTHLRRQEDQGDGKVTVKALLDGRVQSLSVDLRQDEYAIAWEAHGLQMPVTMTGDLQREGNRWRLREPRDLRIIREVEEQA